MILLSVLALGALIVDAKTDDAYYVAGKFYSRISMHLACSVIQKDASSAKFGLNVRSVASNPAPNEIKPPAIEVDVENSANGPIKPGKLNGWMSFSLPMNSVLKVDLPVEPNMRYNERFMSLREEFEFTSEKTFYVVSIGGTREDLGSSEAVGYCFIEAVDGTLSKGNAK